MGCQALDYAKMFNSFNYYYFLIIIAIFSIYILFINLISVSDYPRAEMVKKTLNKFLIGTIISLLVMLFVSDKLVDLTEYLCESIFAYLPVAMLSIPLITLILDLLNHLYEYVRYGTFTPTVKLL